mgnify:CR=1 FL=1
MNERIRELAKEALDYAEKNQSAEVPQHWFKLYNEKFAELIVRECMEQLNISNVPTSISAGLNLGRVAIKEHFGVEE